MDLYDEIYKTVKHNVNVYNYIVKHYDDEKYFVKEMMEADMFMANNNLPMCFFKKTQPSGKKLRRLNACDHVAIDSINVTDNALDLYNTNLYTEIKDVLDNITNTNTFGISDIIHNYAKKCYTVELTSNGYVVISKKVENFPSRCLADVVFPMKESMYCHLILIVKDGDKVIDCDYIAKNCIWRFNQNDCQYPIISDDFVCYGGVVTIPRDDMKTNVIKRRII